MNQAIRYIYEHLKCVYSVEEISSLKWQILQFVCKKEKQILLQEKNKLIFENERVSISAIVEELKNHRPIQYITNKTKFYGIPLFVDEHTLIPRPETEELIELIVKKLGINFNGDVLDIGTGSGCIALALSKHLPNSSIYALDSSEKALEIARKNAKFNELKVVFFQQDIFASFIFPYRCPNKLFSIIVSNPPYVVPSEKSEMSLNVLCYEPHEAIFTSEENPLLFYERIIFLSKHLLTSYGWLFFETHARFGHAVVCLLQKKGYQLVELFKDISGKGRMVCAKKGAM